MSEELTGLNLSQLADFLKKAKEAAPQVVDLVMSLISLFGQDDSPKLIGAAGPGAGCECSDLDKAIGLQVEALTALLHHKCEQHGGGKGGGACEGDKCEPTDPIGPDGSVYG